MAAAECVVGEGQVTASAVECSRDVARRVRVCVYDSGIASSSGSGD